MELALLPDQRANGGFPEPPATEPVRVVAALHSDCGAETRVRLPGILPAGIVRRVRCSNCDDFYSTTRVEDLGVDALGIDDEPEIRVVRGPRFSFKPVAVERRVAPTPAPVAVAPPAPARRRFSLPDRLPSFDPDSRAWRLASIPLAAIAVIAGLLLIRGGGDDDPQPAERAAANGAAVSAAPSGGGGEAAAEASKNAKLIRGSSYSLALPAGWDRISPEGGATFAAISADGTADATLWIERDANLDLPTFIARSLDQLRALAGSAEIVERVPAPTPEATIVRLAADAPAGQPSYEVTLRAAGPYRYYLATSVLPDAGAEATAGAELIGGSFTPEAGGAG